MKALKVFLSIIIGFIMFILLGIFSLITITRVALSGNTISDLMMKVSEQNNVFEANNIFNDNSGINVGEMDKVLDEADRYISKEEIADVSGDLSSQVVKYFMGSTERIDTTKLKETLMKVAAKYEKDTGEKIDLEEVFKSIDESVDKLETSLDEEVKEQPGIEYLGIIYNNGIYIGVIVAFIVLGLLMILINKSVTPLLVHFLIWGIIYFIINTISFILIKVIPIPEESGGLIVKTIAGGAFLKLLIISLIVIILSIVGLVIASNIKKKKKA